MYLSDTAIREAHETGHIVITPWRESCVNPHSYDVHLAKTLSEYVDTELDCAKDHRVVDHDIPEDGYVLYPGRLYLGVLEEYIKCYSHVPRLCGKSSVGRLGMVVHKTAGEIDIGFAGHITLEITVVLPLRVYAGMPVGQLTFHTVHGEVASPYGAARGSKYSQPSGYEAHPMPVASRMYLNMNEDGSWK